MGACGRKKGGHGKAGKTARAARPAKSRKIALGSGGKPMEGLRANTRRGKFERINAWQRTGLTSGKVEPPAWKTREERDKICCPSPLIVERNGTAVCRHCGRILSELRFEHRLDYVRNREGRLVPHTEPVSPNINGPRTVIMPGKKDGKGHRLTVEKELFWVRMNKRNKQYGSVANRSYQEAGQMLRGILDRLGFRDPYQISWLICEWVARNKISQGRTLEATTAAAVYVAAVAQGFPVTYGLLVDCSGVNEARLRRVVAMYLSKGPSKWGDFPVKLDRKKFFAPNRYVQHVCNGLGLDYPAVAAIDDCAELLKRRYCSGHRPETKVAAAIKAVCGDAVSWDKLAQVTGVQVASLKAYWNIVTPILKDLGYLHSGSDVDSDTGSKSETDE